MKIALVHYWLVNMRGGEKVIELLSDLFPTADLFTLVHNPSFVSQKINRHRIYTSFIQKFPLGNKMYRQYLPLHPIAIEQFDLSRYDLVISSESGIAKGVLLPPSTCHICYCHTPMRYLWNMYHEYRKELSFPKKVLWAIVSNYLRQWDYTNAQRVDYFIANSCNVQKRIKKYYSREAEVIHPPVDTNRFTSKPSEDFYLFLGHLNAYKRADLALRAFNRMNKKLVVIGDGPEKKALQRMAGSNIVFLGKQPDDIISDYYSRCRAFIFPGEEDFGITPLEAMASGKPVIAYGRGGALETVIDGQTGFFFHSRDPEALVEAVLRSEKTKWDSLAIIDHAKKFDISNSRDKLYRFITESFEQFDCRCERI